MKLQKKSNYSFIVRSAPVSANHLYINRVFKGRVIRFLTKKGKEFKRDCGVAFLERYPKHTPFKSKCKMNIKLYFPDKRKRDLDNSLKAILDSFNMLIYEDDSQIVSLTVSKFFCKKKPRIEIKVTEVKDEYDKK